MPQDGNGDGTVMPDMGASETAAAQSSTPAPTARPTPAPTATLTPRPELTSRVLDQWAYDRGVRLQFIDLASLSRTASSRASNGRFRDECLNEHWFLSLADARRIIEEWRWDYNQNRPHSSLGNVSSPLLLTIVKEQ